MGLIVGSFCAPLAAQPAPNTADGNSAGVRSLSGSGADYEVEFGDDALHALDDKQNIAKIRVRPGPSRTMLLRARTSFVAEMLKSVEHM
jgi:hypothetical protein